MKAPTKAPTVRTVPPRRKKARAARARLLHIEVRRGSALCLRVAIADDVMTEAGEELGALIKRISPGGEPAVAAEPGFVAIEPGIIVSREHLEHDSVYHAELRSHLVELFRSLCDSSLADAMDAVRQECDRRAEGGN